MRLCIALLFAASFSAVAQSPQVPHKMSFAGMTLAIRDEARREIQKDVDALTKSPKHFMIKAEKARTYFPIIEKILADEGVPDDFKYLVLQESSLVADAVSVSNAVGFWQFKDFTAMEMGLRVDKEIDERMNIASSTRAAARYLKKNNSLFDNWIYALQSYQMGAGAVMRSEKDTQGGKTHYEVTSSTYWYVKKFLAHKVAYENAVKEKPELQVSVYEVKNNKSVADLCKELSIEESELRNYNKWIRKDRIPDDRSYIVLVPGTSGASFETLSTVLAASKSTPPAASPTESKPVTDIQPIIAEINGVKAVQALPGDNAAKIAERANIDLASFLKWNDMAYSTAITPGAYYFLGKKRSKAKEDYYTIVNGETLWMVSQKYGVRLKKLKKYNRLKNEQVTPGTTLWLSSVRPKESAGPVVDTEVAKLNEEETFNWTAETDGQNAPDPVVVVTDTSSVTVVPESDSITVQSPVVIQQDSAQNIQLTQVEEVKQEPALEVVIPATPSKTEHIVQAKETLYAIAKMYNVGVMDLVNWNNLDLQQGLKIGQVIRVAEPELVAKVENPPAEVIHEVASSDTLYSIARKYGVTIKDLMDWNQKKDFSISVGEKLTVKPSH